MIDNKIGDVLVGIIGYVDILRESCRRKSPRNDHRAISPRRPD
jgi:hypothetical protein